MLELFSRRCRHWRRRRRWHRAEPVDALEPVLIERRIDYAMMPGSMIEAVFVGDDADVRQIAEEDQGAKLILLLRSRRAKARPQRARAGSLKTDSRRLECAPDKPRTVKGRWSGSSP